MWLLIVVNKTTTEVFIFVHQYKTSIHCNKQETPQCDENQVFNDSTKY